jgi:hypothetical protein
LEERWDISDDGRELEGPVSWNLGVWISAEDIVAVEQYALNDEQRDEIAQRTA